MDYIERKVRYFNYCGEVNTGKLLETVKQYCTDIGLHKVVIASETGRSAVKALETLKETNVEIVVVTHYPATTWGPKGKIPIGLKRKEYADNLKKLLDNGVKIVQGTRPFAPPTRSLNWETTPEGIIDKTLELFGAGTKIAIEVAVMATDAGEINENEEIISCAGTFKGLDTALPVKTSYSMNFFKNFEVKEIIAKPSCRVKKLPEHTYEKWKGNLDKYYKQDSILEKSTQIIGDSILIRNFEERDAQAIVEILKMNNQYRFPEVDGPEAMGRVKACSAAIFLVYEKQSKVVGAARGNYDGSRAIIHELSVHPDYQKQGIGTALVKEIVKRFQEKGAPTVSATVIEESLGFWQKVGFRKTRAFLVGNWK